MGNRAVITASLSNDPQTSNDIGIYLHWNGGRDSVEAFLEYCKRRGFRPPDQDNYGWARLCQVIAILVGILVSALTCVVTLIVIITIMAST